MVYLYKYMKDPRDLILIDLDCIRNKIKLNNHKLLTINIHSTMTITNPLELQELSDKRLNSPPSHKE
jgi:hypothetical protein